MARDDRYAQALRPLRNQQVSDEGCGWRQEAAGRGIRGVFPTLVGTVDTDQQLDLVVIRRDVLIADGPIEAESVPALRLEVVRTVAERNAPPVIRAPAQHACPPPFKTTCVLLARPHVGFAGNLPASIHRRVVETKWLVRRIHSPK